MKIKRFVAKDMRTALTEVKEFLGPDAIILSNKKVAGGVEIVAAVDPEAAPAKARKAPSDPRLGSTKPIPLIGIDQPAELLLSAAEAKQQLLQLEDDARFNALLDKVDGDAQLSASEQAEFDAFVRRHQALLTAAGEELGEEE